MTTGRATVLVEPNRVANWKVDIADPEPSSARVRVVIGGACGSDVHITTGEAGTMPFAIILGHEGVGRIEKLGGGVTNDHAGVPVKEGARGGEIRHRDQGRNRPRTLRRL